MFNPLQNPTSLDIKALQERDASLNPSHESFDFSLWSTMVRNQMVKVLQNRLKSS